MTGLKILAGGMVTGLGYNAEASLAALRAGISAVEETPWVDPESGKRLAGAKVSLPHWWEGTGKLVELVAPAISECLAAAGSPTANIPLLIAIPSTTRAGRFANMDRELMEGIEARLELPRHPKSRAIAGDQVGGAQCLVAARDLIAAGTVQHVIVAGVDSFLYQPMLDDYVERRRLMTASNSNGFFPGEAGCAVLVGGVLDASADALQLLGIGLAHEVAAIGSTQPLRGEGMTAAVREALDAAGVNMADIGYRLTDVSGEHYKFKEALFVAARLDQDSRARAMEMWHPIEFLGEIGAAIIPCLLQQARHACLEGYAPGRLGLIHVGNDDGARAALVVAGPLSMR